MAKKPEQPEPTAGESEREQERAAAREQAAVDAASALADRLDNATVFGTLFDVSFRSFITRRLAGPIYVVGLVLIGLMVLWGIVTSFASAIATATFWGVLVFLLGLLLTLVAAVLAVLVLRVAIEAFVALVTIAENTRRHRGRG